MEGLQPVRQAAVKGWWWWWWGGLQRYLSVLEGSTAASFADELLQHRSVHLPEGCRLSHLSQMIHAEPETKSLQVLEKKKDKQEVVQEYFKYCVKSRRSDKPGQQRQMRQLVFYVIPCSEF